MALRGTELILFVRAQNQASYTLRRISSDVRALTHARDLHARAEKLAIQQTRIAARETRNAAKIASMDTGGARRLAFQQRSAQLAEQRNNLERNLQSIEDQRFKTNTQLLRNREREIRLAKKAVTPQVQMLRGANARQTQELAARMEAYSQAVTTAQRRLRNLDTSQQKLNADFRTAVKDTRALAGEQALLARQSAQLALAQRQVAQAMRLQRAERVAAIGRTASHVGRAAQFGGLVGTAALGGAAGVAASFDTLVTQAATQARDIGGSFDQVGDRADNIRKRILAMMQTFPATAEEMAASSYDIFSSINLMRNGVVDMAAGFSLMRTANRLAVAGNTDLETSTSALITVVNDFTAANADGSVNLQDLNRNLNTTFAIVRFGRMRLENFNEMMNRIAPAAKGAGMSLKDVGGAMAFLTQRMPSQSMVATSISRLLQAFQHPDFTRGWEALMQQGKVTGPITIGEGAEKRLRPLSEIIAQIVDSFPELRKGGVEAENFFRRITQAGRLARTGRPGQGQQFTVFAQRALRLLTTDAEAYQAVQRQINDDTGEFDQAFQAMAKTQGVQWRVFINQLKVAILLIGQEAIPVFVSFGKYIANAVEWFRNLDEGTRHNIVRIAALVSILSLLGGIVLSIGGGLLTMIATLRILSITSGAAAEGMTGLALWGGRLLGLLKLLGVAGAIAITLKVLWTGDASARDFLLGALSGAAAGFAIGGPLGALIGGITVPVVLEVITKIRHNPQELAGAREAYRDLQSTVFKEGGNIPTFDEFSQQWNKMVQDLDLPFDLVKDQTKRQWSENAKAALNAGRITQQQYVRGMALVGFNPAAIQNQTQAFNKATSEIQDKIQMKGLVPKAAPKSGFDKLVSDIQKAVKTSGDVTTLNSKLKELGDTYDADNAKMSEAARRQRELAEAMRTAREQAQRDIETAASKLTSTYMDIQRAQEQTFGALFQGPWLQSEFGQTAEQWGIKAGITDLTKDLREQLGEFNRFNSGLASIAARGAPAELVDELKALGPDALNNIETLRKSAPKKFNEFIAVWREKQAAIKKATTLDFNKQLNQWFKYGKGIAQQIIFGLRSENVALDNAFKKYVTAKFPDYVSQAVAKAAADEKRRNAPSTTPTVRAPTKTPVHTTTIHDNTRIEVNAAPGEATMDTARRAKHLWKNGARTRHGGESGR